MRNGKVVGASTHPTLAIPGPAAHGAFEGFADQAQSGDPALGGAGLDGVDEIAAPGDAGRAARREVVS